MRRRDLFKFLGAGALAATVAKAAPAPESAPKLPVPKPPDTKRQVYFRGGPSNESTLDYACTISAGTAPWPRKWHPNNIEPGDYEDDY